LEVYFCDNRFVRRLTHLIVLVAFIFSCGGQWAVFQGIAWANMIRDYSQMVPLTQAVQMTFSGKYPCAICKAIAERKSSEQQKMLTLEKFDKKFLPPITARSINLDCSPMVYWDTPDSLQFRNDSPAVPPPRSALI
jgi:hypothetical protein